MKRFLIACLAVFMAVGFSGAALAAPTITFDVPTNPIAPGDIFTVGIFLESSDITDGLLTFTSFGAFFDYDDSYVSLVNATPGANWADARSFVPEPTADWYTAAGWTGMGYTAPAYFEEGPDMLVMSLTSASSPQSTMLEAVTPILLGTLELECVSAGDSFLYAMNRPDAIWIIGNVDDDAFNWDASNANVPQVPIPAAIWLLGSGLLGLVGLRRRQ